MSQLKPLRRDRVVKKRPTEKEQIWASVSDPPAAEQEASAYTARERTVP
jgi:hypothetical protein